MLALLFDGGTLTSQDVDRIVTDPSEVRAYRFVGLEEARELLDPEVFARVSAVLKPRSQERTVYLENGLARRVS